MAKAKAATATGEKKTTTRSKKTPVPTNGNSEVHVASSTSVDELIRVRAYELYLSRGRKDGAHESDWFAAEAEFRTRTA